jgi:hypothetical protein
MSSTIGGPGSGPLGGKGLIQDYPIDPSTISGLSEEDFDYFRFHLNDVNLGVLEEEEEEEEASMFNGWEVHAVWEHSVDGDSAEVDFVDLGDAAEVICIARDVTKSTAGILVNRLSVDNGSSFYANSGDYVNWGNPGSTGNQNNIGLFHASSVDTAISGWAMYKFGNLSSVEKLGGSSGLSANDSRVLAASLDPVDACRVVSTGGGNITGGTIQCFKKVVS